MASEQSDTAARKRTPAYVSYKTFKNAIQKLEHVPDTIDHSVYGGMNGSTRTFLFGALRFLRLIDDQGAPSADFRRMADGDEGEWCATLRGLIEQLYAEQLPVLKSGSVSSLKKSFGEDIGVSVVGPACRFLVQAANDCGIEVSGTIKKGSFGSASGPRRKKSKGRTSREREDDSNTSPSLPPADPKSVTFPMPLTGGREAKLVVPRDLNKRDVLMLKAAMTMAETLADTNEQLASEADENGGET